MLKRIDKILITIIAIGFIFWMGGILARTIVAFDVFIPGSDMVLKPDMSDILKMQNVYLFTSMSLYTSVGYVAAFVGLLILIIRLRKNLRSMGWLFMASVLFLITTPIEFIRIYMDGQLSIAIFQNNIFDFNAEVIQQNFIERYRANWFRIASSLSLLANLTALLYVVWQPLDKRKKQNETKTN